MSEYQYYEFVAIDRPLPARDQAALRAITTRAVITPTRLWNEYHWGDFKGDPLRLMEKYFDAHLYFANWGSRVLMLRFPKSRLDAKTARAFLDRRDVRATATHTILTFGSEDDSGSDDEFDADSGWLASLLPLRDALAAGDLRALKLAWLARVQSGDVPDSAPEPAVPLLPVTAALRSLADFLRIEKRLLDAAIRGSGVRLRIPLRAACARDIRRLPELLRETVLVELTTGSAARAKALLMRELRRNAQPDGGPARTAGELRKAAGIPDDHSR